MIRAFAFFFIGFVGLSVQANGAPSDLVGKWATPCYLGNPAGTEYTQTQNEFAANGTLKSIDYVYSDAKCAGAVRRPMNEMKGTYQATANSIRLSVIQDRRNYEMTANYEIKGDFLKLTHTQLWINGKHVTEVSDGILTRVR